MLVRDGEKATSVRKCASYRLTGLLSCCSFDNINKIAYIGIHVNLFKILDLKIVYDGVVEGDGRMSICSRMF